MLPCAKIESMSRGPRRRRCRNCLILKLIGADWNKAEVGNRVAGLTCGMLSGGSAGSSSDSASRAQGGLGPSSLGCRSRMMHSWKVLGGSRDEFCVNPCMLAPSASGAVSDCATRSKVGIVSVLRRMRAVMGSSAAEFFRPSRWGVASINNKYQYWARTCIAVDADHGR